MQFFAKLEKNLEFPVVIKPTNEGSSVRKYIFAIKEILKNLNKLKNEREILVESYIPGREIQVAIMAVIN